MKSNLVSPFLSESTLGIVNGVIGHSPLAILHTRYVSGVSVVVHSVVDRRIKYDVVGVITVHLRRVGNSACR